MRYRRDKVHFKECNRQLSEQIKRIPALAAIFTDEEIEQFESGITPPKFVWHHDAEVGQMQLVLKSIHSKTGHTGGRATWGGGKKCR